MAGIKITDIVDEDDDDTPPGVVRDIESATPEEKEDIRNFLRMNPKVVFAPEALASMEKHGVTLTEEDFLEMILKSVSSEH